MNGARIAGRDRYETAALFAIAQFGASSKVLIVSGETWADGLPAGAAGEPVLYVTRNSIPQATRNAIASLKPTTYTILGGATVVSEAVAAELDGLIHP